jgi:hypothetical protein
MEGGSSLRQRKERGNRRKLVDVGYVLFRTGAVMALSRTDSVIAVVVAVVVFVLGAAPVSAQTVGVVAWTASMGGALDDEGFGMAVGPGGSIVVTGSFQGSADFDPGAGTRVLTSRGSTDSFVVKLSADGALVWAVSFGGTDVTEAKDVAIDSRGDIYVIGNFRGQTDFDPGPAEQSVSSRGSTDVFVLRLDPNGNLVRVITFGSDRSDDGQAVYVDSRDQVYITGSFERSVNVNPDPDGNPVILESEGKDDVFVIRYAGDGSLLRAWSIGGDEDAVGRDIVVDGAGNVYVAGDFEGKVDFDPDLSDEKRSAGGMDIFVVKFDDAAIRKWSATMGGLQKDERPAISVDNSGSVYVTGSFKSNADFDPGPEQYLLTSQGDRDIFLLKLDQFGGLVWAQAMGGPFSDRSEAIVAGPNGDIFVTGSFRASVDFDPGSGQRILNSAGEKDIFLARYAGSGMLYSVQAMGGPQEETGYAVGLDQGSNVYVAGSFENTANFNIGADAQFRTAAGGADVFVTKRDYAEKPVGEVSVYVPVLSVGGIESSVNN